MLRYAHKAGAVSYFLWGVLHVGAAGLLLVRLNMRGGPAFAQTEGSNLPVGTFQHPFDPVTLGVFGQHAWNLGVFGALAAAVSILNWKNDRLGYWLNLFVVSAVDIGFIVAILAPGYMRLADGLPGPILWALGATLTTVGRLREPGAH